MKTWIFVMNPRFYEVERAFRELLPNQQVDWGTNRNKISLGDQVLIYLSSPTKEIRVVAKVVKILVKEDELIDDSQYINPNAPEEIRQPFKHGRSVVRLELIGFILPNSGFDFKTFSGDDYKYRGHFQSDFCLNNSANKKFKDYLMQEFIK